MLIGVRGPFKIYGINIPELEKHVKKIQGGNISIYPQKFLFGRKLQRI